MRDRSAAHWRPGALTSRSRRTAPPSTGPALPLSLTIGAWLLVAFARTRPADRDRDAQCAR